MIKTLLDSMVMEKKPMYLLKENFEERNKDPSSSLNIKINSNSYNENKDLNFIEKGNNLQNKIITPPK